MPDQLFRVALVYRADDFGSWCKLPVAGCWLLSWLLGRSITLQYRVYSWWAQRTYCRRVDYGCVFVDCDRACVHVIIETLNCLIIAINSDLRETETTKYGVQKSCTVRRQLYRHNSRAKQRYSLHSGGLVDLPCTIRKLRRVGSAICQQAI